MQKLLKSLCTLLFCVLTVCVGLFVSAAHAEEELAPGFHACTEKAQSTADNVECLNAAYNYWDKALNANFKKAQAACEDTANAKECRAKLLKAQRLWIQYKEAMGDALYGMGGGGTMDNLTVGTFLAEETKKQAQLLAPAE
ncbi:MAG: DUF1311 domain-containing protein [Desulfovibrio sp.]|nr:DUF1311 domain-containing protein [Desulfovibrio sp.]